MLFIVSFLGAWIGWGVIIISIVFSVLHGLWLDNTLSIHIEVIALQISVISRLRFIQCKGWRLADAGNRTWC